MIATEKQLTGLQPFRELAAAVIHQAIRGAKRNHEAWRWVTTDSYPRRMWCEAAGIKDDDLQRLCETIPEPEHHPYLHEGDQEQNYRNHPKRDDILRDRARGLGIVEIANRHHVWRAVVSTICYDVMTPTEHLRARALVMLDEGLPPAIIARRLGLKRDTVANMKRLNHDKLRAKMARQKEMGNEI